jgi:hypothetical protein
MFAVEHDEIEAGCTDDLDQRRIGGEHLDAKW